MNYDAIVIGAGPGGYVAALRLAGHNLKVAIIEREKLGGTCLNCGCIPTKALLHTSEIAANIAHSSKQGIIVDNWKIDLATIIKRKNQIVSKLNAGVAGLLKAQKVDIIKGSAKITGTNTVHVDLNDGSSTTLQAENIVIATGSDAVVPGFFPQDRSVVMTSTEILDLEKLPKSIMIVGGGVIGAEFATFFNEVGVKVTIVEMLDRILPMADKDISTALTKNFKTAGIDVYAGTAVEKMTIQNNSVSTDMAGGKNIKTDIALICTGRRPLSDNIGLETVSIKTDDKGFIDIDEYCCTNIPNIYAIGDVTGKMQLAHVASRQAAVAANNIAGKEDSEDYAVVPAAVYTHPEIAWVGITLDQAKQQGINAREKTFPLAASGLAMAYNATNGFTKIVADDDDIILGAHLVCPHASDIIQQIAILIKAECTLHELKATIHGHPTFAEALAETTDALLGHPLHSH